LGRSVRGLTTEGFHLAQFVYSLYDPLAPVILLGNLYLPQLIEGFHGALQQFCAIVFISFGG
jgi:hypothetical protein